MIANSATAPIPKNLGIDNPISSSALLGKLSSFPREKLYSIMIKQLSTKKDCFQELKLNFTQGQAR
jgi:hypothetical protein